MRFSIEFDSKRCRDLFVSKLDPEHQPSDIDGATLSWDDIPKEVVFKKLAPLTVLQEEDLVAISMEF